MKFSEVVEQARILLQRTGKITYRVLKREFALDDEALEDLSAAEEFLEYFGIAYDARTVQVNRLHILQRFHDYIGKAGCMPQDDAQRRAAYARLLQQAYDDFVKSDALTEKVFKVFHMHEPQTTFVPLADIRSAGGAPSCAGACQGSTGGSSSEQMGSAMEQRFDFSRVADAQRAQRRHLPGLESQPLIRRGRGHVDDVAPSAG
jgi:nitrogenase-stabilizing/protective protein